LSKIKKEAAPGADGISAQMMFAEALKDVWLVLFNVCWTSGIVLNLWRKALIVPGPVLKTQRKGICGPD
jgi:hypothetical protein